MKNTILIIICALSLSSCFEDTFNNLGKGVEDAVIDLEVTIADQEFKKAIAYIELHKIRNGEYPSTLDSLKFINRMDSSFLHSVEYIHMDSVYSLNLTRQIHVGKKVQSSNLPGIKGNYPDKFWQGLGCVESNLK